eukprot:4645308-Amphidinium_carterae.1
MDQSANLSRLQSKRWKGPASPCIRLAVCGPWSQRGASQRQSAAWPFGVWVHKRLPNSQDWPLHCAPLQGQFCAARDDTLALLPCGFLQHFLSMSQGKMGHRTSVLMLWSTYCPAYICLVYCVAQWQNIRLVI